MSERADVVVVGAGVVGALTALLLARSDCRVQVVERTPPAAESPTAGVLAPDLRTLALAPDSLELLRSIDAWNEDCERTACPYRAMEVWDAEGTGRIRFEAAEVGVTELGRIVGNHDLVRALFSALEAAGIERICGRAVTALEHSVGGSTLVLDDASRLSARLVVGADGANSRIRELAGIECSAEDTGQRAIATLAEVAEPHEDTAWQRFLDTGPLAFLPLPDDGQGRHRVSVVWSVDDDRARSLEALDDEGFAAALEQAFERRLGAVCRVDRRVAFPLQQRHARSYRAPGVVLVGDAAHVIHPMAGQGVNLGIRDARVLAGELRPHLARGAWAVLGDPDLLHHYERTRRGENAIMLRAMTGLRQLFGADHPALRWLRNQGLRWVDGLAPVKREFMIEALGLGAGRVGGREA